MFCKNCGKELADNALFCEGCGAATDNNRNQNVPPAQPFQSAQPPYQQPFNEQSSAVTDNTTLFSTLAYIGILFVIGLIADPHNQKVRFHVNQGCVLFLTDIILVAITRIFSHIFGNIPVLGGVIAGLISFAAMAGILVLAVIGIKNASKGEEKELPIIGKIRIIK